MIRFPDYLEVTTAVVVSVWSWKNFSPCINMVLISFSYSGPSGILVLVESRIPLKRVLGGVRIVALPISSHEQTQ